MCKTLISLTVLGMMWAIARGYPFFFGTLALCYIAVWIGFLLSEEGEPLLHDAYAPDAGIVEEPSRKLPRGLA